MRRTEFILIWLYFVYKKTDAAEKLGIRNQDRVEVKSSAGKGRLKARVTRDTRPDTVYMDTGFGALSRGLTNIFGKGACIAEVLEDHEVSCRVSGLHDLILKAIVVPAHMQVAKDEDPVETGQEDA